MNEQVFNKVLSSIYFLADNWIEECFASKQWIIPHFQGKYNSLRNEHGTIEATFRLWITFDLENRELFYKYINSKVNK